MPKQTHAGAAKHSGRVTIAERDLCHRCQSRKRWGRSPWCRKCLEVSPVVLGGVTTEDVETEPGPERAVASPAPSVRRWLPPQAVRLLNRLPRR